MVAVTLTLGILFGVSVTSKAQTETLTLVLVVDPMMPGTFWSLQNPDCPPLPFDPFPELPLYSGGNSNYVYDDSSVDYAALEAQRKAAARMARMSEEFSELTEEEEEEEWNYPAYNYSTNDLWLEIVGFTNNIASLVIHRPWNDTNVAYDLYYTTNLAEIIQWSYVTRWPYTNVLVTDLEDAQGFFRLGPVTNGDLTVSTNMTPAQLAQMLVPCGVTVTNATYTGADEARGFFSGGNGCGLPIETGVILSSGNISNAIGSNDESGKSTPFYNGYDYNGDPDLDDLVGVEGTKDAAVLEFNLIPTNSFVLRFQYIFASEEYPEYIGPYNDPMAIFVSTNYVGTNWIYTTNDNIALVPSTNLPVTVNTINGGCVSDASGNPVSPTNPQYYVDNHDPSYSTVPPYAVSAQVYNIQYDGLTVRLTARAQILANVTNHVKIAIADYRDAVYDSAVFIKAAPPCP